MRLAPLALEGAFVLEVDPREDARGLFARTFCEDTLAAAGLETRFVQCNTSWNAQRGTIRGLHFQEAPHEEVKIVRCTRGAAWDVIVDVRPGSPTFGRAASVTLDADARNAIYVPRGFAHGFQALVDGTELFYMMSARYAPEAARGLRFDDPALGLAWPLDAAIVSPRDATLPTLDEVGRERSRGSR